MSDVPWIPDELTPEADQIREVYAWYGVAMYYSQVVEQTLQFLLATVFGPGDDWLRRHGLDVLLDRYSRRTFGQLAKQLKAKSLPDDLILAIGTSVEKRNWLAHNYFYDRSVEMLSFQGRSKMISELAEIRAQLRNLDERLMHVGAEWRHDHGVTEGAVKRELDRLKRMAADI
jgi:hypothetical protein